MARGAPARSAQSLEKREPSLRAGCVALSTTLLAVRWNRLRLPSGMPSTRRRVSRAATAIPPAIPAIAAPVPAAAAATLPLPPSFEPPSADPSVWPVAASSVVLIARPSFSVVFVLVTKLPRPADLMLQPLDGRERLSAHRRKYRRASASDWAWLASARAQSMQSIGEHRGRSQARPGAAERDGN